MYLFLPFSLKSFKQRLQDRSELPINLELATVEVKAGSPGSTCQTQACPPSEPVDDGSQTGLPSSNPDDVMTSESSAAVLSAALSDHTAMEEDTGKPGAEEKVMEDQGLTATVNSAANVTSDVSPAPPGTELGPKIYVGPPQINEDIVRALKVVVQLHRVNQDVMMQSMKDAVRPSFKCHVVKL